MKRGYNTDYSRVVSHRSTRSASRDLTFSDQTGRGALVVVWSYPKYTFIKYGRLSKSPFLLMMIVVDTYHILHYIFFMNITSQILHFVNFNTLNSRHFQYPSNTALINQLHSTLSSQTLSFNLEAFKGPSFYLLFTLDWIEANWISAVVQCRANSSPMGRCMAVSHTDPREKLI